jgi:hypothetical protein
MVIHWIYGIKSETLTNRHSYPRSLAGPIIESGFRDKFVEFGFNAKR